MRTLSALVLMSCVVPAASWAAPIVIAHRGASGYLPEHTLEAYVLAHGLGADYIEPDLVMTKDGRFICLHDIHLEATTDVEEAFPERKREDGRWYAADFALEEIKRLRVHERLPKRFPVGAASFRVPTFEEMIELVQGLNATTGRTAGIYPELKAPGWHQRQDLPMERAFLEVVRRYGYRGPDAAIFVQCFEPGALETLRTELGCALPQIQLIGGGGRPNPMLSARGLARIAAYAEGIGPDKRYVEADPDLVARAHAAGLAVHPYTLRADAVPRPYAAFEAEAAQFFTAYGVDGVFTDFPDRVRHVIEARITDGPARGDSDE